LGVVGAETAAIVCVSDGKLSKPVSPLRTWRVSRLSKLNIGRIEAPLFRRRELLRIGMRSFERQLESDVAGRLEGSGADGWR
jgi:hypothetical protein